MTLPYRGKVPSSLLFGLHKGGSFDRSNDVVAQCSATLPSELLPRV